MKLYYYQGACSLVVRIVLNELGLVFESEKVDLKAKKTESGADFFAINPKGAVPALSLENGDVLTENQVILQYLADTNSQGSTLLAPVGSIIRYRTLEWLNYMATELHKSIGLFFNPTLPEEVKTKFLTPLIMARFNYVNKHLEKNKYMMGEEFTLPDAYLFVMVFWAHHLKIDISSCTHLNQYIKRVKERPAVIRTLEQEQLPV